MRAGGSAQFGLSEWLLQRLSALYLAGFVVWLVLRLGLSPPKDFAAWQVWFGHGTVRLAFALAFLNALVHAWVGMRSVFLDYFRPAWLRLVAQMFLVGVLVVQAFWAAEILLIEGLR
jgi:succinate dehydrogenase / fumarate reductase membrane anchor subunit